jgi:hypothetical protein
MPGSVSQAQACLFPPSRAETSSVLEQCVSDRGTRSETWWTETAVVSLWHTIGDHKNRREWDRQRRPMLLGQTIDLAPVIPDRRAGESSARISRSNQHGIAPVRIRPAFLLSRRSLQKRATSLNHPRADRADRGMPRRASTVLPSVRSWFRGNRRGAALCRDWWRRWGRCFRGGDQAYVVCELASGRRGALGKGQTPYPQEFPLISPRDSSDRQRPFGKARTSDVRFHSRRMLEVCLTPGQSMEFRVYGLRSSTFGPG